jgi:hypothetical protein
MKRLLLLLSISLALASCGAGRDKKAEELAYARFAERQSLDAYQICAEENVGDENQCSALIKLMDEDNRRIARLSKQ